MIWLEHGSLTGDDTDGHIDNLARFANPSTILYAACDNQSHPDYESLKLMQNELSRLKKTNGENYNLIPINIPEPIIIDDELLPASYMNFLITNELVLVPMFEQTSDHDALKKIQACFPDRIVKGINANSIRIIHLKISFLQRKWTDKELQRQCQL